jgi:hypothetical protein
MKERLTYQSLMGYETRKLPLLRWPLDASGGDARILRAISLKIQCWKTNRPQKRSFPGRD